MPAHKSNFKRMRTNEKRNIRNRAAISRLKTTVKGVTAVTEKDKGIEALKKAYSVIDKTAKAGIIHKNAAANKKARLAKRINALSAK